MKSPTPPQWPIRLLQRILSERQLEILYGDTLEVYHDRFERLGGFRANWLFVRDALSLIRPFTLKSPFRQAGSHGLYTNFIKLSFRHLHRNRIATTINLTGLVLGLFAALMIGLYARYELSYDRFHEGYENIYRVSFQRWVNNDLEFNGATTFAGVGKTLLATYPEVTGQCRFYYPFAPGVITIANESFHVEKPVFADESYFSLFSFDLLTGHRTEALSDPNKVVLSKSLATAWFKNEDPMGETITFSFEDGSAELTVTGIIPDPVKNSHIRLDMIISTKTLDQWPIFDEIEWRLPFYHTYISLDPGRIEGFETRASSILANHRKEMQAEGVREIFQLQPLQDIHLDSDLTFELAQNGSRQAVRLMIIVAGLILVIVYLNYVNLVTALNTGRAREVGIRKVLGSFRSQVILQFVVESIVINLLAFGLATGLVFFTYGYLSQWMGIHFSFATDDLFWIIWLAIIFTTSTLFGLIPATMVSSLKPLSVLRGKFINTGKGASLRKTLVTLQFVITMTIVGGMVLLSLQTDYLLKKDPGFPADQVLVIHAPPIQFDNGEYLRHVRRFGQDILTHSSINGFTHSGSVPGKVMGSGTIRRVGESTREASLHFNTVDFDYFHTYDLQFLAGEPFARDREAHRSGVIINLAALNALNFQGPEEAVGSTVSSRGQEFKILGVVENYHHTSVKVSYEPIGFVLSPERTLYMSVNMKTDNLISTLDLLESKMKVHFPGSPVEYFFLDRAFHDEFRTELTFINVFKVFSLLAVLLATMGLYGLSAFILSQREKEIGIRKTLGAGTGDIFRFLGSFFLIPWAVGSILALIVLYQGGTLWLETFPFRINWPWVVFGFPLGLVVLLSGLMIGIQTWKARHVQPADVLKYE